MNKPPQPLHKEGLFPFQKSSDESDGKGYLRKVTDGSILCRWFQPTDFKGKWRL